MKHFNPPREVEVTTINCICDSCGVKLDNYKKIWMQNEHFGCSKSCVTKSQRVADDHELRSLHSNEPMYTCDGDEKDTDLI